MRAQTDDPSLPSSLNPSVPPSLPSSPRPAQTRTQIRETCAALARVSDRVAALRRRAQVLEAELEADGSVAGDGVSELCL